MVWALSGCGGGRLPEAEAYYHDDEDYPCPSRTVKVCEGPSGQWCTCKRVMY